MIDRTAQDVIRGYKRGYKAGLLWSYQALARALDSVSTEEGRAALQRGWENGFSRRASMREGARRGRAPRRLRFRPRWQKPHYNRAWNNPRAR